MLNDSNAITLCGLKGRPFRFSRPFCREMQSDLNQKPNMTMRAHNFLSLIPLCSLLLVLSPATSQAQNATYIGPVTGGEWNTAANWDLGVPGSGTNATINAGTNVNYNLEMTTGGFALLTNSGVLNINTNDFVCTGIAEAINSGGDKIFLNNGAGVTVNGNVTLSTNAAATMSAGSSLIINGALDVDYGSSSKAAGTATFTNSGGLLMANSTAVNNNTGTATGLFVISGGTNNLGTTVVGRGGGASFGNFGTEGLLIYGGQVTMSNLNAGNSGDGNSSLTVLIAGGVVTNVGNVYINQGTGGSSPRGSRVLQTNGFFAIPDPGLVNPDPTVAGSINIFAVTGGTNVAGGLFFGNGTGAGTVDFTNSAVMYIGSQGISSNGAVLLNATLNNGGMFGATAPWTGSSTMRLNSGTFTFQTADMTGLPNNITLINPLIGNGGLDVTGDGTLTMDATNTYVGGTYISSGTLSLGQSGVLAEAVYVGSGAIYDVSELTSAYTITSGETVGGFGTVTGAVNVASGGVINPGSNTVTGTLTLQDNLAENGGAINEFTLTAPAGGNDLMNINGNLTLSGSNSIVLTASGGGPITFGTYPLFKYTGTLSGGITNFSVTLVSDTATLTNMTTTPPEIAVILSAGLRPPTNIIWKGDGGLNDWNTTSSNWFNASTSYAFLSGDSVFFTDAGAPNTNVDLTISALPTVVIFSNTIPYTLSGIGSISGPINLIKTNTGSVTLLTTNTYTGITYLDQGVLSTPLIANSLSPSAIGEAGPAAGNIVFNGGTLAYFGPSTGTDHGMTLTNGGGTIDVSNSISLTLNGTLNGPGSLTVVDNGTLILPNPNTYTGGTIISNALLNLDSDNANNAGTSSAFGPTNTSVTLEGGATLELFGAQPGSSTGNNYNTLYNPIVVPAGQTGTLLMFPRGPSNTGGSAGLFSSLAGGGTLNLHVNYVRDALSGNWSAFTGLILVTNTTAAGGDEMRLNNNYGYSNATIYLNGSVIMDSTLSANATINIGALGGVSTATLGPGNESESGPTWCVGWNNQNATFAGTIENDNNAPTSPTSIIKVGTGTWDLEGIYGTNEVDEGGFPTPVVGLFNQLLYTGDTTISNGTLALIDGDNVTNSPDVTLASSTAVLDASQMAITEVTDDTTNVITNSTFEVVSGQTLNGIGTLNGILQQDAGSTFNVGLPTGSFTVTTNASLSGAVNMSLDGSASSELISPAITANSGSATLTVTNAGPGLINGVTFHLFSQGVSGGFASVTLPATDPTGTTNYVWANNLGSSGTITLTSGGLVAPAPKITVGVSAGTLSLSWGSTGYTLQLQTNSLSVGLSTNWVNVPGSTSLTGTNITINPSTGTEFFRLMQ
jgi:fibronectin-binding autotransporter adhesin